MKYRQTLMAVCVGGLLLGLPGAAFADGDGEYADVIIQMSSSTVDQVSAHIASLGGTVRFRYRNLSAIAARVPTVKLKALGALGGVSKVERDIFIDLPDTRRDGDHPMAFEVAGSEGFEVTAVDPASITPAALPSGYANFRYTGAADIWGQTNMGAGTIVAIIDSGTAPVSCIEHAVIGAPGYPDGYNAIGDGESPMSFDNNPHGTWVGGVIASACALSVPPENPLAYAVGRHLGWSADFIPVYGQAPFAAVYPVKVFPWYGGGAPTSVILDGMDHVLTMKKSGQLDIDIVNMSLGGPTGFDGRDAYDRFVSELEAAGMLVVISAGNSGPKPQSIGSPGTSKAALTAASLDYAPSSRTLYEWAGLAIWPGAPGQGMIMRPSAEVRVSNFSSRGPLADGRAGPSIAAQGSWNFVQNPYGYFEWVSGTSFSAPTVSGAAALLNAYWEGPAGQHTDPARMKAALIRGANATLVGAAWRGLNNQGAGALDLKKAFDLFKSGAGPGSVPSNAAGTLAANVFGVPKKGVTERWSGSLTTLYPGQKADAVVAVDKYTSRITFKITEFWAPDNSASAFWANGLEVHVQGARRSAFDSALAFFWYPGNGTTFTIDVRDGVWITPLGNLGPVTMEPGFLKLTLAGDATNQSQIRYRLHVTREGYRQPPSVVTSSYVMYSGDAYTSWLNIPAGTRKLTLDLDWAQKWDRYPSNDIDLVVFDPSGNLYSLDGASFNAPERAVITSPAAGLWSVMVIAYEMFVPDTVNLYAKRE